MLYINNSFQIFINVNKVFFLTNFVSDFAMSVSRVRHMRFPHQFTQFNLYVTHILLYFTDSIQNSQGNQCTLDQQNFYPKLYLPLVPTCYDGYGEVEYIIRIL